MLEVAVLQAHGFEDAHAAFKDVVASAVELVNGAATGGAKCSPPQVAVGLGGEMSAPCKASAVLEFKQPAVELEGCATKELDSDRGATSS